MERQEIAQELADAQDLIASTSAAHLAYTAKDGTPRVVPVGYYWTGAEFVVATHPYAPKLGALRERTDVALAIDGGGTPGDARALSIRGTASITVVDGIVPEYLAAAHKSMEPDVAAEFDKNVRAVYDQQARIAITPAWVRFYDFGAGRMPRSLQAYLDRERP
ncbi:pyridoxamine 5'-phosphate oxidase family protein [Pseudonocardia nematodicida]|uniref:Pyridoxamine 5'-phosphate oxidase family protein n=1 Tax=Pseudonocardia nematodicida TaxID=1206997 RepID=A0ABV1KM14_9PSEU